MAFSRPLWMRNEAIWDGTERSLYFNPVDMNISSRRYETFGGWPTTYPDMRGDMVNSGLFYTGTRDVVKCFHCGVEISGWHRRHNPNVRHREASPNCPMVADVPDNHTANVPMFADLRDDGARPFHTGTVSSSDSDPSVLEHDGPAETRSGQPRRSHAALAPQCDRQKVKELAEEMGYTVDEIAEALQRLDAMNRTVDFDLMLDTLYEVQHEEIWNATYLTDDSPGAEADLGRHAVSAVERAEAPESGNRLESDGPGSREVYLRPPNRVRHGSSGNEADDEASPPSSL